MLRLPSLRIDNWRTAIVVGCCLFVLAQAISVAHTADLKLHGGGVSCHVCAAIGHTAPPPSNATAPEEAIELVHRIAAQAVFASPAQPTFSPHAARAPPALF
jgi:hypothetical protein